MASSAPTAAVLLAVAAVAVVSLVAGCTGATHVEVAEGSSTTSAGGAAAADVAAPSTVVVPVSECTASLPIEAKVAQLLMVLVDRPSAAKGPVSSGLVGGYALVGTAKGDIPGEVAAVAATSKIPVFASADDEGGTVQRLRDILGPIPAAAELAASGTAEDAAKVHGDYAARLRQLGFNMNLGPVFDVGSGSALGTRSFGDSVDLVSSYGVAVMEAVRDAGVLPVAKHWPGLGGGVADPHLAAAPIAPFEQLRARDIIPFQRAIEAGVPAIMVSHAIVPDLTDGLPASLSRAAITGELRLNEGFDGLVITDSLGMGAISLRFDDPQAAAISIAAGADIALLSSPNDAGSARQLIVDAVATGGIAPDQLDRSVDRVLRAKGITGPCPA